MVLNNRRRSSIQDDAHTERWLISYADYMTLLFAVFVVMYAFAAVKNENYAILSESFGVIFHLEGRTKQAEHGSYAANASTTLLTSGDKISQLEQVNQGLLEEAGSEPIEGNSQLVNIDKKRIGTPFSSMTEKLQTDLLEVLEQGYAKIEQDDNWLTIEFSSGLLFDSGSATARPATTVLLEQVVDTIAPANNYVHVRGYTDNQPINNEQFKSNWQLSSARASAIVELLQQLDIEPERLAIEAYGQYRPKVANSNANARAINRRVVIAISRYGWEAPSINNNLNIAKNSDAKVFVPAVQPDSDQVRIINLPHGGLRITTRNGE
jgi:chemotaxis protein MotB